MADIPEGKIRRHRHPRLPRLSGGHQATAGEARGAGSPPHRQRNIICERTFCQPSGSVRHLPRVHLRRRAEAQRSRGAADRPGQGRGSRSVVGVSTSLPGRTVSQQGNALLYRVAGGIDVDVGKHQHHFARGRSGQEVPGRETVRQQLLPFLMPGHRTRGSGPKWAVKADPCFYLNGGNDHASDCDKVMLESGIVSYTTNATYAYRRAPFVGQQVTFGNGVIRAPLPPPAATSMGGSGTGGLAGSDAVTAPCPPPAASSARREDVGVLRGHPGRKGGIGGGTTLSSLSPVASSTEGDTSGLRNQSEEWRKSGRLDIPAQQDNPRSQSRRHTVTPAVTRSAARTQLGVGDQPGAFTV